MAAKSAYQAYSVATRTVAKTRQVVMLYDGAIRFLRQAKDAIAEKRIEDRFNLLLRASQVVSGLRNSIDFEKGGEVANVLKQFYAGLDIRILSINFDKDDPAKACDDAVNDLKQMRDVWDEIDRNLSEEESKPASAAPQGNAPGNVTLSA